jgi:hypothetical protein
MNCLFQVADLSTEYITFELQSTRYLGLTVTKLYSRKEKKFNFGKYYLPLNSESFTFLPRVQKSKIKNLVTQSVVLRPWKNVDILYGVICAYLPSAYIPSLLGLVNRSVHLAAFSGCGGLSTFLLAFKHCLSRPCSIHFNYTPQIFQPFFLQYLLPDQ